MLFTCATSLGTPPVHVVDASVAHRCNDVTIIASSIPVVISKPSGVESAVPLVVVAAVSRKTEFK